MMQTLVTSFPRLLFGPAGLPCGSSSIPVVAYLIGPASLSPLLYLVLDLVSCLPDGWRSHEREGLSAVADGAVLDGFLPTGWWSILWSVPGFEHASRITKKRRERDGRLFFLSHYWF